MRPSSSLMSVPPVSAAMSPRLSLRRSPKPGAFTPTTLIVPRSLFTASVASASPSMSSAMISRFLLTCSSFSSIGRMSLTAEIFLSVMRM